MTQTPNPPAGWYPQDNQERWWDGTGWSDNFRPLGSDQTQQPGQPMMTAGYPNTYQQVQQPGYAQPTYGQPQPYLTQPVEKSHTARNILIVFAVLFLVFVGGCIAVVAVVGGKVNDAVNDDSVGGPNNPLTITEGKAFEVNGFEYADGWTIVGGAGEPDLARRQPQGHQPPRQGRPAGRQAHPLERRARSSPLRSARWATGSTRSPRTSR